MRVPRWLSRTAPAALVSVLAVAAPVSAAWLQSATATSTFSTATLAPPTALAANRSCLAGIQTVTLSWTPTASTWATGYRVWRKAGAGAFAHVGTVVGRLSSGYIDTPLALTTTYTYYVTADYSSWSASSTQVSATTLNALCL
jgi:hypothetical protein